MDNTEVLIEEGTESRIYEIGYLLSPFLTEEELASVVSKIKDITKEQGATFVFEEDPKKIELAYTMTKNISNKNKNFDEAYFGWFKFESNPETIALIEENIKKIEAIIRFLLVKTTRENNFIPRKFVRRQSTFKDSSLKTDDTSTEAVDEKKIDQEIDALVEEVIA